MFKGQSILNAIVGLVSLLFSNNKLASKVYECILSIFMKFKNDLSYFPFFFTFLVCVCVCVCLECGKRELGRSLLWSFILSKNYGIAACYCSCGDELMNIHYKCD